MRTTVILFAAALTACGAPRPREQARTCQTFTFAGECVHTTLSQAQWIDRMHRNPPHAECVGMPVVPGYDGVMQCEASQAGLDRLRGMPAGIGAPSVVIVAPSGW